MVAASCKPKTSPPVTGRRRSKPSHPSTARAGLGRTWRKYNNPASAAMGIDRTARLGNTPRIGHDGIELAQNLRRDVERRSSRSRPHRADLQEAEMLRGVRLERINQNVHVNNPRLNRHGRTDRSDGEWAYQPETPDWQFRSRGTGVAFHPQAGVTQRPSPNARDQSRLLWQSALAALPARGEVQFHAFKRQMPRALCGTREVTWSSMLLPKGTAIRN